MRKIDYVAVLLVYRNYQDLLESVESIQSKIPNSKCIVVNAFYDQETLQQVRKIALSHNCDFLNIENKGYSFGNNEGIKYANDNYEYKYLIISNPDIIVQNFSSEVEGDIIAPKITRKNGRTQNPMVYKYSVIVTLLEYYGLKKRIKALVYLGIAINKVIRECGVFFQKLCGARMYPIYAAHGSFLLMSKEAINKLGVVYDDRIFLFTEELVLAIKAKNIGLTTYYTDQIGIIHKEDGSMKLSKISVFEEIRKSNIIYYENYIKFSKL